MDQAEIAVPRASLIVLEMRYIREQEKTQRITASRRAEAPRRFAEKIASRTATATARQRQRQQMPNSFTVTSTAFPFLFPTATENGKEDGIRHQ